MLSCLPELVFYTTTIGPKLTAIKFSHILHKMFIEFHQRLRIEGITTN